MTIGVHSRGLGEGGMCVCGGGGGQLTLPTNMAYMRIPSDHQSAV